MPLLDIQGQGQHDLLTSLFLVSIQVMRVVELQGQHPDALKRQIILTPDLLSGLQVPKVFKR